MGVGGACDPVVVEVVSRTHNKVERIRLGEVGHELGRYFLGLNAHSTPVAHYEASKNRSVFARRIAQGFRPGTLGLRALASGQCGKKRSGKKVYELHIER